MDKQGVKEHKDVNLFGPKSVPRVGQTFQDFTQTQKLFWLGRLLMCLILATFNTKLSALSKHYLDDLFLIMISDAGRYTIRYITTSQEFTNLKIDPIFGYDIY